MKFICNTEDLSNACQNVSRAASGKTAIPAIEGILITSGQNSLTLTGYDLEMGITTQIPSNIEENGSIVLNAHMLSDILRRLPGDTVSLESDSRLRYCCGLNCLRLRLAFFSASIRLETRGREIPSAALELEPRNRLKRGFFGVETIYSYILKHFARNV